MRSTIIDAGSQQSDVWGLLQGTWNEYDSGEWHVVKTPFFTTITMTADAGGHPLPWKFRNPVVGLLYLADGDVKSVVVRPGEISINVPDNCIFKFQLFGNEADVTGVL